MGSARCGLDVFLGLEVTSLRSLIFLTLGYGRGQTLTPFQRDVSWALLNVHIIFHKYPSI